MRSLLAATLLLFAAQSCAPVAETATVDVTESGVNGEALADAPETDAIDMWAGNNYVRNQLSLTLTVTPGDTATVSLQCYESETGLANSWAQINECDSATCPPDVRQFELDDFETQGSVKVISSRWHITKRYAKCKADDALDGTGTVVITGTRSWQ